MRDNLHEDPPGEEQSEESAIQLSAELQEKQESYNSLVKQLDTLQGMIDSAKYISDNTDLLKKIMNEKMGELTKIRRLVEV